MTSRRGFIAAMLAVPMAAARAMSKVVHGGRHITPWIPMSAVPGETKIIHQLWVEMDAPHGVYFSVDGGPQIKTPWPMLPIVPLKIDIPPWVQNKMPTVTFKAAGDEAFRVYGASIYTDRGHTTVPERTIYIGGSIES